MLSYVQIYSFEFSGLALAVRLFFQTYCNILKNYLSFLFTRSFSTESGCKDNTFFCYPPNFLRTFFDFFSKPKFILNDYFLKKQDSI